MKNMNVFAKLMTGFLTMTLLILIIAAGGIYGVFRMGSISHDMYENKAAPLGDLALAMEYFQRLRVQTRNAIIYTGELEQLSTVEADMKQRIQQFRNSLSAYKSTTTASDALSIINSTESLFNTTFEPGVLSTLDGAKRGEAGTELLTAMAATTTAANTISDNLSSLISIRKNYMSSANNESYRVQNLILSVDAVVIFCSVAIALLLAFYIARIISKPLKDLSGFMDRAASTGDIRFSDEDERRISAYSQAKDEIGRCIKSVAFYIQRINNISNKLHTVSTGDLSVVFTPLSESDIMGNAVKKMMADLNATFSEVQLSSSQVSSGSRLVAEGSQILAQGSTEQAAAVEQLSASVNEISSKTKESAVMASNAAALADSIKISAEKGSSQMDSMMDAVREINQASLGINKVIKVIDDIAFQTNILALNAAVEAARAGQHGKGFAVVAEEVRSLAAKSAEAAKDTGGLINNSIEKAELGARIANETSASLKEIVEGINESTQIIVDIARYSDEQVSSISQLHSSIDQVSQVTQRNSATAEESSAASQQMNSQAILLDDLISRFKLADNNKLRPNSSRTANLALPSSSSELSAYR